MVPPVLPLKMDTPPAPVAVTLPLSVTVLPAVAEASKLTLPAVMPVPVLLTVTPDDEVSLMNAPTAELVFADTVVALVTMLLPVDCAVPKLPLVLTNARVPVVIVPALCKTLPDPPALRVTVPVAEPVMLAPIKILLLPVVASEMFALFPPKAFGTEIVPAAVI